MAKAFFEVEGFDELQRKIIKFADDKDKTKAVISILRNAAKSTITVARSLAPKDTGVGAKSIKFEVLKRSRIPMGIVGPRSKGQYDGWYLRQFIIPGTKFIAPNSFMARAQDLTRNQVIGKAIPQMERFLQKKINAL